VGFKRFLTLQNKSKNLVKRELREKGELGELREKVN
tara:strand:+ start:2409 stop:2516 length:108 start_codon:yes stop_codon:yes gene_type:complete